MEKNTKANSLRDRNTARESTAGKMVITTKVSLPTTEDKALASTTGAMGDYTKVNGKPIA